MWIRDSLARDFAGARVFIYGYDTRTIESESFQNIGDLGLKFKEQLTGVSVSA